MFYRQWAIVSALLLSGCQVYEPMPVDLDAHAREWTNRSPSGIAVSAFAKELAALNATQAQPFDPSDGFSLSEAEVVALMFNPRLRSARLRARVPLVGAGEAGRWDDPRIDLNALRILESVDKPLAVGRGDQLHDPDQRPAGSRETESGRRGRCRGLPGVA